MEKIKKIMEIIKYSEMYTMNELLFKSTSEIDDIYYECLIPILKRFKTLN